MGTFDIHPPCPRCDRPLRYSRIMPTDKKKSYWCKACRIKVEPREERPKADGFKAFRERKSKGVV